MKFHLDGGAEAQQQEKQAIPKRWPIVGLLFTDSIEEAEEAVFKAVFERLKHLYDAAAVTEQDIKNVALFTATVGRTTAVFIEFIHTETYDKFLHSLIVYIDYFLLVLECLLIRRDDSQSKIRDSYSLRVEQMLAKRLSDRRLIVAREYSKVAALSSLDPALDTLPL